MNHPRTLIIAEAGVNHNGSPDMARQLIDVAAQAGADAVKFQTFKTEANLSRSAPKAEYQIQTTGAGESQWEMVKKLELDEAAHEMLAAHCREAGIEFLSTPFDFPSIELLVRLGVSKLKAPSGEITNAPLLLQMAQTGLPVILSTGMSVLGEVETALGVLAFGYTCEAERPTLDACRQAFGSDAGQAALHEKVSLLHCTTEYPAPFEQTNLRAMDTLHHAFGLPVGLSDHTVGIAVSLAAVARGATIIEKHFTLDRTLPGPDHRASLEPGELRDMVAGIRQIEAALGSPLKAPTAAERPNRDIGRRSLVALRPIARGEAFSPDNIGAKRPGSGVSALRFWEFLERRAARDFAEDELIEE